MAKAHNLLITAPDSAGGLAPADAEFFDKIIESWERRRVSSQRHTQKAVSRDIAIVRSFAAHCGLPPWLWNEDVFDAWCDHLALVLPAVQIRH